jgi:aerobic carbon-monoxide dehydrogenase small subunit
MCEGVQHLNITCMLNGSLLDTTIPAGLTLFEFIRETQGLLGTKLACSRAACGACTVLVDGVPAASCALFAFQVDGSRVDTVESLASEGSLHPIQDAFRRHSAFQCGYCSAGMMLLAKALLDRERSPSRQRVTEWMSSNICRCTGYALIIDAVLDAAHALRRELTDV